MPHKSPATLIDEYRDALREYHKDNPAVLERVEIWEITYNRGWYYIDRSPVRRKEIERRVAFLLKGKETSHETI